MPNSYLGDTRNEMKSFIIVLFVFVTILSLPIESMAESVCSNDATYEDDGEFLPPQRTFELPENFELPVNITTNPMYFNEEDQMMQGRIVNGDVAGEKAFPYQVLLKLYTPNKPTNLCGGSILTGQWIVTAAHCTQGCYYVSVGVGSNKIKGMKFHNTSYIIIHPQFNLTTIRHDISLIKLCKQLIFNEYVSAIRLPDLGYKCEDFVGKECTVSGFGLTESNSTTVSDNLHHTSVNIISNIQCMNPFLWLITPYVMCSQGSNNNGPCKGDSGGPLTSLDKKGNFPVLVGIVSFGSADCGITPEAYTRVQPYLTWIKGIIFK